MKLKKIVTKQSLRNQSPLPARTTGIAHLPPPPTLLPCAPSLNASAPHLLANEFATLDISAVEPLMVNTTDPPASVSAAVATRPRLPLTDTP